MQVTSLFDKGDIQLNPSVALLKGAASADIVFKLGSNQRSLIFLMGAGPAPASSITVQFKSKVGAAAAVPLAQGRPVSWGYNLNTIGPVKNQTRQLLGAGGKLTIPQTVTVGDPTTNDFVVGFLFDVPVLPDGTDQLAMNMTVDDATNGVTTNVVALMIGEHARW
jgi:hypothetical protein